MQENTFPAENVVSAVSAAENVVVQSEVAKMF